MDYRVFESILDPVIVVSTEGEIKYINPVAIRWLTIPNDFGIVGKGISEFVTFSESKAFSSMENLGELAHSYYHLTHFVLANGNYEALAKICVQRLPNENEDRVFAIIVHDRAFIKTLLDEDEVNLKTAADVVAKNTVYTVVAPKGLKKEIKIDVAVLAEDSIVKALPQERRAHFECTVNLVFVDLVKAAVGKANIISDEWIEISIKPLPDLHEGMKVNLEVAGNVKLRGFSTVGELIKNSLFKSDHTIRVKFGTLSTLSRRAIDEFLEINVLKY